MTSQVGLCLVVLGILGALHNTAQGGEDLDATRTHRRAATVKVPWPLPNTFRPGMKIDLIGEMDDPARTTVMVPNVLLCAIDSTYPGATSNYVTVMLSTFEAELIRTLENAKGKWRILERNTKATPK